MIDLYTADTPNGHKASICLEELELPYEVHRLDLGKLDQKQPAFLAINPNGRIPALVDRDPADGGAPLPVFESGAILLYLAEKTGRLCPTDARGRSLVVQWLMFQMGGVGPMMGQASVFVKYAPEKIPFAIARYQRESRRLFEVLDRRLGEAEYLAGDYSVADIATWPWIAAHAWIEVGLDGLPNLSRWKEAVGARPAVQRGRAVPGTSVDTEQRIAAARKILA